MGVLAIGVLGCSDDGSLPEPCVERVEIFRGDDFAMRQGVTSVLKARRVAEGSCETTSWTYQWSASPAGIVSLVEESDTTVRVSADNQGLATIRLVVDARPTVRDSVGVQVFF